MLARIRFERCPAGAVASFSGMIWAVLLLSAAWANESAAQNSSMYAAREQRQPLTIGPSSWTYESPPEVKTIKLHDIVTIIVSEQSVVISEGEMDRKKKAHGDLKLKDWILLDWLEVFPDPQGRGDPHIRGEVDNKLRAEAGIETRDSLKCRVACSVVDIRPNGNLIIEGHRTINNNEETWDVSLNGEIRPTDVLPNNTVLSENVAGLRLAKRESGHVRDGYRRGWLLRILDRWQPF